MKQLKVVDDKKILQIIEKFLLNCFEIKKHSSQASFGTRDFKDLIYQDTLIKVSFGTGRFTFYPWIAFLNYNQSVQDGIYPLIIYSINDSVNNFRVCYGVSKLYPPVKMWPQSILNDKPLNINNKFAESFVELNISVKDLKDYLQNQTKIIEALNAVIEDYHGVFKKK